MKEDYLSSVKKYTINNRTHFKLSEIKNNLIDDIDTIKYKLNCFGINTNILEKEYVDIYSLILLIVFSCDFRAYKYKFFMCSSTIEKLSEIINPDLCIDRCRSIKYKKGYKDKYNYTNNKISSGDKNLSFEDIVREEINNSININTFRHII